MMADGMKHLTSGSNPILIKRGIEMAVKDGCTVALDGQVIVDAGQLTGELA